MSLRADYDTWHKRIHDADPSHEDGSSPWYQLVREYLGEVAGLCILEVACGRGGFTRQMANAGARVTGCDFSSGALCVARTKLFIQIVHRLPHSFRATPKTCLLPMSPSTLWFPARAS